MATLDELLGQSPMEEQDPLEGYFDTSNIKPEVPDFDMFDEPALVPRLEESDRNAALDFVGQGLWSFLDTAAFSVPSLLMPEEMEKTYLTPETIPGKVGSAIGGTVGFIAGAPMKVGAKAATMLAKPFIKKAGAETIEQITKKTAAQVMKGKHHKQFLTESAQDVMNKQIGGRVSQLMHKTRWDVANKGVADNWARTSAKAIDDLVDEAVQLGNLTTKEGVLLASTFKKNVGTRPMQDFVDVLMKRFPNKWGWLAGNMVHEAAMFGMIDAAMEVSHSLNEDRDYDFMAPLWGVGIGGAFGALKLLPAAGKQSITGEDFRSGVRAVFSKNHFAKMTHDKLITNSHMLGKMKALNEGSSSVTFKDATIDLRNPLSSIMSNFKVDEKGAGEILRDVLNAQRLEYGKKMMGAAITEDMSSSLANWKRVIAGTAIMNTRMMMEMSQGHEMAPEDVATSLLIGAWLNRRGRPLTPEMNMKKMQEIRANMHYLGEPQSRIFDVHPTLGNSQFSEINPLTSEGFKSLREKAEAMGFVGDTPESVEVMSKNKGSSLASTDKSFPLFDIAYTWMSGALGKRYIKPKALITEKEAQEMQDLILKLEYDGKSVTTVADFEGMLKASTERITDGLEYELALTLQQTLNKATNLTLLDPSGATLGTLPKQIRIDQGLVEAVRKGQIKYEGDTGPISPEKVNDALRKINKLIEVNSAIYKGEITQNPKNQIVDVKTADQLRELMDGVLAGESRINKLFNTSNENLRFDFDGLDHMLMQLMYRKYNKGHEQLTRFFSDTENPKWNEFLNVLNDAGVVSRDPENATGFRINDMSKIKILKEGEFKGDAEESMYRSVVSILAASGNSSLNKVNTTKEITVTQEQAGRLTQYLNENKISTQKELLDLFRTNITQKLSMDIIKSSKVTGKDLAILGDLSALGVPLAKYSTMQEGGVGFTVSKIAGIGTGTQQKKYIAEYNEYVDNLIKRSKSKKGKSFISASEEIAFLDKNDIKMLASITRRKNGAEGQRAVEQLVNFVSAIDPQNNLRASIGQYLMKTENPNDLLNFMLGEGLITTRKKKGAIDYVFKAEKILEDKSSAKLAEWLKKFGVHSTDIEAMSTAAEIEIDNYINMKHKGGRGTLTQQSFFAKYFPDAAGFGSKFQETVKQNEMLTEAIYDAETGGFKPNAHKTIIDQMEVKVGRGKEATIVKGSELQQKHPNKYNQILDDVQKIVAQRVGSISKPVLSVRNGKVVETMKTMQGSKFTELLDEMKIPYTFVDGEIYSMLYTDNTIKAKSLNVFDLDSPHNVSGFGKNATGESKAQRKAFDTLMAKYEFADGMGTGAGLIRFGNGKQVLAVPKTTVKKVAELFQSKIYDQYYERATDGVKEQMSLMKRALEKDATWGPIHEDAMRTIIVEGMTKGKEDSRFLDYVQGTSTELADLGKRFNLYHTPSFKKMNSSVLSSLAKNVTSPEDANLIRSFSNRDLGFIVWNDEGMAGIKGSSEKKLAARKTSWETMLGSRPDVSGFDSITFISENYKRMLELYYGASAKGSNVFKPIITSNGKDALMFAKTVFVYDPAIQKDIFAKKPELDIMLTKSADKLKSSISEKEWNDKGRPDRPIHIDKTVDEMLKITSKEITEKMKTMPMGNVGVSIIPEGKMLARQSYSIPNYMNTAESGQYYDAFYGPRLDKMLGPNANSQGVMEKMVRNSLYKRVALLKLKNMNPDLTLNDMQGAPEGMEGIGHQLMWAALGGDPRAMGDQMLINTIKSQFLDPILSPYSVTDAGEVYGGKSVIKQNFTFRDLDPTIRTGEKKGDTNIYPGEIMLPSSAKEGAINFKGKDLELRIVDKEGNSKNFKKTLKELYSTKGDKTKGEKALDEEIDFLLENGNLEAVHNALKALDPDLSIEVLTTRYPRTSPNDLTGLRLKGFLKENEGNTAIVNDFDVLNIFEGDYDVDEVDFFWGMNKGTWRHVQDQKRHWVNTVNTEHYTPKVPDLKLMTRGANNDQWNQFDANNRTFKKGIGVVQKTVRLVNNLASLGVKNTDKTSQLLGMSELMNYSTKSGEKFTIAVDYDNSNFFARTALESQLIIDYWKGVPTEILNTIPSWRNDYLFQPMSKSIGQEQVASLQARQQDHLAAGPENSRLRIFRKYDSNGREVDLSAEDITAIQTLMAQHSKLLTLGTKVYDSSGQGGNPTYDNIMDISRAYFGDHMPNMTKAVFNAVVRKHGQTQAVKDMFGPEMRTRAGSLRRKKKLYGKMQQEFTDEITRERVLSEASGEPGIHTYRWFSKSPLLDGVLKNGQETAQSRGNHGSVIERIYREIMHRDPLGGDGKQGKSEVILQGDLYNEMQSAASDLLSEHTVFGENPMATMKNILPKVMYNVKEDVKQIKYLKNLQRSINRSPDLAQAQKNKRLEALDAIIREREIGLKDLLSKEYQETGDAKLLKTIKIVDITQDKEMEEGTIQWYTLNKMVETFRPTKDLKGFAEAISEARKMGGEEYAEFMSASATNKMGKKTLLGEKEIDMRLNPKLNIQEIEAALMAKLEEGFNKWGPAFIYEYAMPTRQDGTVIGIYNGNPMPVSTKNSGRFKRAVRFLLDQHAKTPNKKHKAFLKEGLESLAKKYTAYRNFFDGEYGLIPFADRDVFSIINNAPGFDTKIKSTFDRYESIGIEKGQFSKDVFGMGAEYDSNMSFYRRLINDAFGQKTQAEFTKLEEALSYTNQLVMENQYMDPISHYMLSEQIRTKMSEMGLDKAIQGSADGESISPHALSPEMAMLMGRTDGISIKPIALLSEYRLNMLKKFIKQGQDIKKNQKLGSDWQEMRENYEKAGNCK